MPVGDYEPVQTGDEGFGGMAKATLAYVTEDLIPALTAGRDAEIYIGRYSLAGFFALWAAYQTDIRTAKGFAWLLYNNGWVLGFGGDI